MRSTKSDKQVNANPRGSVWNRWDPHIHTPGTVLNDQYSGTNPMEDFLKRIENSTPKIKALGITDYYSLETYEKILEYKRKGRLRDIELIFPNVEIRLNLGTGKNSALNVHLIFSPETQDHISEARRFLQKLIFSVGSEKYQCSKSDLEKLGLEHDKSNTDKKKALEIGTLQFKVNFNDVLEQRNASEWAKENVLIAVSASSNDGTSGLKSDDSFSATRKMVEKFSNLIFSGNPNDREFWLGRKAASREEFEKAYFSYKPCIHGSDAHTNDKVGKPDQDRFTWIKGDVTFEALRQVCIEPEDRVIVGVAPPMNPLESNLINSLQVKNANWISPKDFQLNSGLIAIIGARGSGKTALADMIAEGGFSGSPQINSGSFVRRAYEHLENVQVTLDWLVGGSSNKNLWNSDQEDESPRIQYLSQQFVDRLCSSEGVTDELLLEIEKVIFHAHPPEDRLGLSDFKELLGQRCSTVRMEQVDQKERLDQLTQDVARELSKKNGLTVLKKKLGELGKEVESDKQSQKQLLKKGEEERLKAFQKVSTALEKVTLTLQNAQAKQRALETLKQKVKSARENSFPNFSNKLKEENKAASLTAQEWKNFEIDFIEDVDNLLSIKSAEAKKLVDGIRGLKPSSSGADENKSFIPAGQSLTDVSFEVLTSEVNRLKKLVGIDNENGKQYGKLNEKIVKRTKELDKLKTDIADAESAEARIKDLIEARKETYRKIFKAILVEEEILRELYKPLMENLSGQAGSMGKLKFTVRRHVNTELWSKQGEDLLDLRTTGTFKGKGAILEIANTELKKIWERGTDVEIAEAISKFRTDHEKAILEHALYERSDQEKFNNWANKIGDWLYSTDHISITYGVSYDGVDIQQLSPGTRGIVLLLLYLAIDKDDDRPLIIDQPEENLDPKSIFDELVPIFRSVKKRRQIIIITHNANLVVNADADQVIIAHAGAHQPGRLPDMKYYSGGLENQDIRKGVCEILEGGEAAFRERAKRLRVAL